jgi:glucose-1-phosphate thymidylyltransferase
MLENLIVNLYVSIGNGTKIVNSVLKGSIIQENTDIIKVNLANSMVGNFVTLKGNAPVLSVGV